MSGAIRLACKLLVNDRAKFGALPMGITFAVFLMVEMTSKFGGVLKPGDRAAPARPRARRHVERGPARAGRPA